MGLLQLQKGQRAASSVPLFSFSTIPVIVVVLVLMVVAVMLQLRTGGGNFSDGLP